MILLRRIYRTHCQRHIRALSPKLKESLLFGRSVIRAFLYMDGQILIKESSPEK